jgi:DnaK suppressor protein
MPSLRLTAEAQERLVDTKRYREELENKRSDLENEIGQLRTEGREARSAEVEDPIDYVTSSQGQAAAFELSTKLTDTLEAVRDALRRIDEGTYGRCLDCGREIETARLDAVPWALYCKDDQEKHDAANRARAAAVGDIS